MSYIYKETDSKKFFKSDEFNFVFDKTNGNTSFWGKTIDDDTDYNPWGCMIADIEITTACFGVGGKLCEMCYKSNSPKGKNMSFETFKKVFDNLPEFLTQIAFGVDSTATSNPDIWKIFDYCIENNVTPNLTVADISDETADNISKRSGACAISVYDNKNIAYDSIKRLTDRGMKQVNIHHCVYEDNFKRSLEIIDDMKTDSRLSKMNAIVFLGLKNKGRGKNLKRISQEKYETLIRKCLDNGCRFGMDSCSGNRFASFCKNNDKTELLQMVTGCESTKQSLYVNVDGEYFPCSFIEGEKEWETGIDMLTINDFVTDVWQHERVIKFRNLLKDEFSICPRFKV
jgi:hypothetical protein